VTAVGSAGILPAVFLCDRQRKRAAGLAARMLHALNAPLKPKFGAGDVDDQTIIGTAPCQNAG
jgi:hypothetical protein